MSIHFREHLIRARSSAVVPVLLGFLATVPALSVNAATTVAMYDVPLQTRVTAAPNVMFILDDSGSMQSEILPGELTFDVSTRPDGSRFSRLGIGLIYPRRDYVYGQTHNGSTVDQYENIAADPDNQYGKIVRSPYFNSLYYNPAITYSPWLKADGTSFPAALATCAYHNPQNTGVGCRDLTTDNTNENSNYWQRTSKNSTCTTSACVADATSRTYKPAVYYRYTGSNASTAPDWDASKFEQVVVSSSGSYSGDGRAARDDAGCVNGTCSGAAEMQNFANWYTYYRSRALSARAGVGRAFALLDGGTATRPAVRVGFATINTKDAIVQQIRNFVGTDRTNFFDKLYGVTIPALGTPLRRALEDVGKNYKTDAPWAADPAGSLETKPLTCRQSFSILMTDGYWSADDGSSAGNEDSGKGYPFQDAWSGTLADVAMKYWATDLRSDLADNVPTTAIDTAKHQHMVTFGVGLGVSGSVDPSAAFSAIGKPSGTIVWPEPAAAEKNKVDDLLHAAVNSRGGYFSATDPKTFGDSLKNILSSISARTASGSNVAANSVALREETRLFQASYVAGKWTGELVALKVAEATGVDKTPVWRATDGIPAAAQRKLFTSNSTTGVTFPSTTQSGTGGLTADEIAYIRGVQTKEQKNSGGTFRNRDVLLGDIVNSSPAYVRDSNALFVGANDGFLHAINASNGSELFAYMPKGVTTAALKDFTKPGYEHKYFVDGPVSVGIRAQMGDKDFLVGSMGRGGKGVFALDVTNPATFAASNVLWDDTDTSDADMGNVLSKPLIVRLNGAWNDAGGNGTKPTTPEYGVIVANGVNSTNNKAALFIYRFGADGKLLAATGQQRNPVKLVTSYVTPTSGATPDNSGTGANGLASIRGWDNDGDGVLDYVYGGDLQGNVWKFDLDSTDSKNWTIANSGSPMFVARNASNKRQSITGGFSVSLDPVTYKPWIFFGTGRYLEVEDIANKDPQTWYGLRDDASVISSRSDLQARNLVVVGTIDSKPVRGFESHSALTAGKKGWYVDLLTPPNSLAEGERMVADPLMLGRALVAASIVPSADPCDVGGRGYLNAIDAFTGSSVATPFFDVNGNGSLDDDKLSTGGKDVPVGSVDIGVAMPTSPTIVESLVVAGGSLGTTGSVKVNNPVLKTRISWHEVVKD